MPVHPVERKLTAIFAADIAGYSRLMSDDEIGTLGRLKACRVIVDGLVAAHRGRIFNTAGDSVVADFASAVDAVQCAVAVQAAITTENAGSTADEPMQFRIGVHVGDVIVDGNNLLGDGVNLAARLESLAEPGAICVSAVARDHIGGSLEDVFELQDKVACSVADVIEPALQAAEMRRSAARPTIDLTAYDLYLRALAVFFPITKERIFGALGLLEQAIAIDRHYAPALSWAALCHMRLVYDGWTEEPETTRRKAVDLARQALQVGENDPGVLTNAALVLARFGEDIGAIIGLADRVLALNPSYAYGWIMSGVLRNWAGQHDLAIEHLETSLRLSPRERMGQPIYVMGVAYFFKRQFDEAMSKLLLSIQDHPGYPPAYRALAACYAHMGRHDEARAIVTRLRAITPQIVPSELPWRNSEDRELLLAGLRLAMRDAP